MKIPNLQNAASLPQSPAAANSLSQVTERRQSPEQRTLHQGKADRREFSVQTLWRCLINPRRSRSRRQADRRFPLVDVFGSTEMTLAVSLMLLSLIDATFTLTLISRGGSELNPVMNYFLMMGKFPFVAAKVLLTAIPTIILIGAGNYLLFKRIRVRTITAAAIGGYAGLIVYELLLLSQG